MALGDETSAPSATRRRPRSHWHPAKIRAGLRRRWFEYRLERLPLCGGHIGLVDLGSRDYGGWTLPERPLLDGGVCYSVGAGGDISFDLDLIARYGMTVRAVDPVASYVDRALADADGDPRLTAHLAAIATEDGPIRMQLTHDESSQSVSAAGLYESGSYVELPGRTVASLMAELGDEQIDVLKLDIEGGEYEVVPTLDLRALGVKVFATQLHHTGSVQDAHDLVRGLAASGYVPVAIQPVVKIAFIRRDLL